MKNKKNGAPAPVNGGGYRRKFNPDGCLPHGRFVIRTCPHCQGAILRYRSPYSEHSHGLYQCLQCARIYVRPDGDGGPYVLLTDHAMNGGRAFCGAHLRVVAGAAG